MRSPTGNIERVLRDPPRPKRPMPHIFPRVINVAWASITKDDFYPGELVANQADNSLVWRKDHTNIFRFDNVATRAI